ncbi:hypothetical protein RAB80_009633 [Fusarium oxysporum f. sp. vasinfectum]|nr:hypothetical protein RAB80_009633 [Fusarium oxysporum f. sp. vasinfectum]
MHCNLSLGVVAALLAGANAHGHVAKVIAGGKEYTGGIPHGAPSDAAISGGGDFTTFYTPTDPGILFNLYQSFSSYPIPGPAVRTI